MEKTITQLEGKTLGRINRNNRLFKTIIEAIHEKKGQETVSLDLKKIDESVADFFILCQAQSALQVKSIADNIEKTVMETCDEKPYHIERGDHWTLVDYVNIVVHIFQEDHRHFYNLEQLWEDAGRMEHND
ncbi:MAG: ribosome silencing factor [Bacteroidetes bacterium]|nr:ribosome silencing factor [Bacteroidota bacterium]